MLGGGGGVSNVGAWWSGRKRSSPARAKQNVSTLLDALTRQRGNFSISILGEHGFILAELIPATPHFHSGKVLIPALPYREIVFIL